MLVKSSLKEKNTITDVGSTTLQTSHLYTVFTDYTVFTVYTVCNVYTVNTVNTGRGNLGNAQKKTFFREVFPYTDMTTTAPAVLRI